MAPHPRVHPVLLQEFLAQTAAHRPDAIAVEIPPGRGHPDRQALSYSDLAALSDRLALHLAERIDPEHIVALLLPRSSPLLVAAQIAVLKAGGAYTTIDLAFPNERIEEVLKDAEAICVLTDQTGAARLGEFIRSDIPILEAAKLAEQDPPQGAALPTKIRPDQLAYVIYTSGTTGRPKGVMVEHRNIVNLVASDLDEFGLTDQDRVIQGSSAAYDSSIEETWLALASGATLVVMDDEAARLGPDIVKWLRDERASVFCPPPTLLRSSGCDDPQRALPTLRLLYVGGEALPRDIADLWSRGRRMVNGYGPTECAVTCLRGDITEGVAITIGQPVPGMQAYVLDDALNLVADGLRGELCIGGAGVARGYRGQPQVTAEKFIDHPRCGRVYRTGDLVHRGPTGDFIYHGRIDAQVKIRGYRVELSEIDVRLTALPGVRAAAARLQDRRGVSELVAFVVPEDGQTTLDLADLRKRLAATLPAYMVPQRIATLDALPTTVGGKLDRGALPLLSVSLEPPTRERIEPATALEWRLAEGVADILGRPEGVSVEDDFFEDLGGDSLSAALLVTLLREDNHTDWITISDLYDARTVRGLAALGERSSAGHQTSQFDSLTLIREGKARPGLANLVQGAWLLGELLVGGWMSWAAVFKVFPFLLKQLDLVAFVLLTPLVTLIAIALYIPTSVGFTVLVKRLVLGRYRPIRAPVWSAYYLRHWVTVQCARLIPWAVLKGTIFEQMALRALGARIGRGVHIHRGVDLHRGGWDLLEIGDNVALGQDVNIGLVELDRGDIVVGPITIDERATLQTRAGLQGHCRVGADSVLAPLSVLNSGGTIPPGEIWDGVPARPMGPAPHKPHATREGQVLSPMRHGILLLLAEGVGTVVALLPTSLLTLALCRALDVGSDKVWRWLEAPAFDMRTLAVVFGVSVMAIPLNLAWSALMMRVMGKVEPGVISRWSLGYIRVWLKSGQLDNAGKWLSGTLFWPFWLRLAGMKVGANCEISTIIDVVPELVTIGEESFFADGIYLGGGQISQGLVTLAPLHVGRNTFIGNHAVIAAGEDLPDDILIGIATVADGSQIMAGQSRFGHPSFDLPRRQVITLDRRLTHEPSAIRYANRMFWELLRFTLPILPLMFSVLWYQILAKGAINRSNLEFALVVIPFATLAPLLGLCFAVTALKWSLIGRVKPGQHALWSCWASRWDFVYVAWARYAHAILRQLEGTFLLMMYLRLMGLKIGRRAVLGPQFAQVVDPDMIEIGDDATVTAFFQAHTFEDRVLKVDKVRILEQATVCFGTIPMYGSVVGAQVHVGPHSVIMKQEHLSPGLAYQGVPLKVLNS